MNYKNHLKIDNQLYVSGQIPDTLDGKIEVQISECLNKILTAGKENGMSKEDLVSTTVYLTDINDLAVLNDKYQETGINEITTRSTVEVSNLAFNVKAEISAIFIKGNS